MSFVQGAAATDAGQTSHHAIVEAGELRSGQRVGIVGLGGVGTTGARIAVLNGAEVYGAEPRREAWSAAMAQGLQNVVADVSELAQYELDLIVDFAGFGETTAGAVRRWSVGVLEGLDDADASGACRASSHDLPPQVGRREARAGRR